MDENKTHIMDPDGLREKRLLARTALFNAGKREFKTDGSAKWTDFTVKPNGIMLAQVQHDDLEGLTPEMVKWFFEHLGCCTTWNGKDFSGPEISIYHLWHYRDHVAVTPLTNGANGSKNLGFLEGADSRIHELTNEVNDVIYFEMNTICLNEHEFTFNVMKDGKSTGHVKHVYCPNKEGTGCTFYAETQVGMEGKGSELINKLIVPHLYSQQHGTEWIHHNIQETGRMQDVAPVLFANQEHVFYDPAFTKFD